MRITTSLIATLLSAFCLNACGQDFNPNRDYSLEEDEAIFSTEEIDRQLTQEKPVTEDSRSNDLHDYNSVTIVSTEDVVIVNETPTKPIEQPSSAGKLNSNSPKKIIKIKPKWSARQ
ncbi:MAG: hypothetical protein RLZZ488_1887 [Pseudomonadota bacterium]|jgi:hypothetical protein